MGQITKAEILEMIDEAKENGKSKLVKLEKDKLPYLRVIVSQYNKQHTGKFRIFTENDNYRGIKTEFDRFFDTKEYKPAFDVIQKVLTNPELKISDNNLQLVKNKLKMIINKCEEQCLDKIEGMPKIKEKPQEIKTSKPGAGLLG